MINYIVYSKETSRLSALQNDIDRCCGEIECTFVRFEYPMDLLDYINQTLPHNSVVFFETDLLQEALEISYRIYDIAPQCRFVLLCREYGNNVEELFEKGVSYFIELPYEINNIVKCVDHFDHFFNEQYGKNICLKTKKGQDVLHVADIKYIMSDKRKVVFYLEADEKSYYYKLDEIEPMITQGFLRCHQSYIVNMRRIKQFVEDGLLLDDDEFIPISRKKYYASKREYISYVTGGKLQ